jgi:hypothetical protein
VDRRVGAELGSCPESKLADIGGEDALRSARSSELNVKQSRDATANHQDGLTGGQARKPLCPDHTSQWLDKRAFIKRDFRRQAKGPQIDIDFGDADELSKTAGVEVGRAQHVANGLVTSAAVPALTAGYMMGGKHAVADVEVLNALPHFDNLACDLMTQHQRRFLDAIPFHEIAAANPAGANANQQLSGSNPGNGHTLEANVSVVIVHRDAHGRATIPNFHPTCLRLKQGLPRGAFRGAAFGTLVDLVCLFYGGVFVNDGAGRTDHTDRTIRLKDIPTHVDADGPARYSVVGQL